MTKMEAEGAIDNLNAKLNQVDKIQEPRLLLKETKNQETKEPRIKIQKPRNQETKNQDPRTKIAAERINLNAKLNQVEKIPEPGLMLKETKNQETKEPKIKIQKPRNQESRSKNQDCC